MRLLAGSLVMALSLAVAGIQVVETAPSGSDLDLADVANAIDVLPGLFAQAESSIDVSQMYMLYYPRESKGRLLYSLYDALIAAAQRGVRVRILLDSTTLEQNPGQTYCRMPRALSEVPGVSVRACDLRPYSLYPECMLHAKYCVIDSRVAVVGSHNWSFGAFADNRELSLVVSDAAFCQQLGAVFATDWCLGRSAADSTQHTAYGMQGGAGSGLRLAVTAPDRLRLPGTYSTMDALSDLFGRAESTLDVEVNSLTTRVDFGTGQKFGAVESMVQAAAGKGVRVRLLVDKWAAEHEPELFRRLDSVAGLDVRIVDIASLGPNPGAGTVHAKLVIADGAAALVGSATFSQRQLLECRNVGALVHDREVVQQLGRVFERDWRLAPAWKH